jgi:hypothetical protein
VYRWPEYIRLLDDAPFDELLDEDFSDFTEEAKYNLGDMYFVRFGRFRSDPVWTIDLLSFQSSRAREILECLLGDTVKSYPIPCYPQALIDADAAAQVSGLDRDLLHQEAIKAIRSRLTRPQQQVLDAIPFAQDFAARRYK